MIDLNKIDDFFILDLANNHQGDLDHAINIIDIFGKKISDLGIDATIKLQFRNLDSYIHKSLNSSNTENSYVKRFQSTRLQNSDYSKIVEKIKSYNLRTMTTPFDEDSFSLIDDLDIDIIKIASASANDKSLLNQAKKTNKPCVISVGGKDIEEIDEIVNFFENYTSNFILQHCVAVYPTPDEDLELNQISFLNERYPNIKIGYSTHENPNNYDPIKLAYSLGARSFERHIGLETNDYKLNAYSSNPEQFENWINSYKYAKKLLGASNKKPISNKEKDTLNSLTRGVYAKKDISSENKLNTDNIYFSFPLKENQLSSNSFEDLKFINSKKIKKDEPILLNQIDIDKEFLKQEKINSFMLQFKSVLKKSKTFINHDAQIELSHHYGLERFREFGCLIVTCFNYDYAKKLILLLPRQKHPYHFHKKKEETFQILYGDLEAEIDGNPMKLKNGDICTVKTEKWHKFQTSNGVIFEEISTKHFNDDSYYKDPKIANMDRSERKTQLKDWENFFKQIP